MISDFVAGMLATVILFALCGFVRTMLSRSVDRRRVEYQTFTAFYEGSGGGDSELITPVDQLNRWLASRSAASVVSVQELETKSLTFGMLQTRFLIVSEP